MISSPLVAVKFHILLTKTNISLMMGLLPIYAISPDPAVISLSLRLGSKNPIWLAFHLFVVLPWVVPGGPLGPLGPGGPGGPGGPYGKF